MKEINLYKRACENNGVAIISDIELLILLENAKKSTRHPKAAIIEEQIWSSSQGNWGGENGIATYLEKKPFTLENLEVYRVWQETFNNDGNARGNDEERMSADAEGFNEAAQAVVIEPLSSDQWEFFLGEIGLRIDSASHEELVRIAMFLNME